MLVVAAPSTLPVPHRAVECPVGTQPPKTAVHVKQSSWWNNTCAFVPKNPIVLAVAFMGVGFFAARAMEGVNFTTAVAVSSVGITCGEVNYINERLWDRQAIKKTEVVTFCSPPIDFLSPEEKSAFPRSYAFLECIHASEKISCDGALYYQSFEYSQYLTKSMQEIRQRLNKRAEDHVTPDDLKGIKFVCDKQENMTSWTRDLGNGKKAVLKSMVGRYLADAGDGKGAKPAYEYWFSLNDG